MQRSIERWYSQYLLDPVPPDGQCFKQSIFEYWWHPFEAQGREVPPDGLVLNPDKLTKYMGVDPATGVGGDESAIVVVGVDDYRRLFVVDVVHGQFSEAELIDLIFAMNRLHQPDRIGPETAGGFAGLMVTRASVMEMRGEYLAIEKMPPGNTQKEQRIAHALAPWYQMKKVYHPVNQCGGALEEQLLRFPKSRFDDIMDAYRHAVVLAQTYGLHDVMRGLSPGSVQSGIGIQQLQESALVRPRHKTRMVSRSLQQVGELMLELMQARYGEERTIPYLDGTQPATARVTPDMLYESLGMAQTPEEGMVLGMKGGLSSCRR